MSKIRSDAATLITSKTRFPPSRRPASGFSANERRHIRHVGEIVHAWNTAHGALFKVFYLITTDWDIWLASALWHSIQSDKGQREMLESVVKAKRNGPKPLIADGVLWAIRALNSLSTHRNDAAHVEILRGHPEIIPEISVKESSAERLEDMPLSKYWRRMRGDLYAIANYLDAIYWALWVDAPRPLSRRPKLLFARTRSPRSQRRRRQAKTTTRERQRAASRG